jgi:hypothetical protein
MTFRLLDYDCNTAEFSKLLPLVSVFAFLRGVGRGAFKNAFIKIEAFLSC